MLERERCWLVQVASVVLNKQHASSMAATQGDVTGVYEGYKHNGIALSAISSGECVVAPSVKAHAGYDSRLDAMAGLQGRNCLAAPIMAGDSKASARCVGVMFATNKAQGGFQGDVCDVHCIVVFLFCARASVQPLRRVTLIITRVTRVTGSQSRSSPHQASTLSSPVRSLTC
jgi:hypothetical protein